MKDIKHFRQDFHSAAWVMPRGGTWGCREGWGGGGGGVNFFFSEIQPDFVCELLTCMAHAPAQFFWSPPPGALGRGQTCNLLNMVSWHIKLKGVSSGPGYTENFYPTIKLVTFGWVNGSITIRFLREQGD